LSGKDNLKSDEYLAIQFDNELTKVMKNIDFKSKSIENIQNTILALTSLISLCKKSLIQITAKKTKLKTESLLVNFKSVLISLFSSIERLDLLKEKLNW
jgi:hypothetical protein